MSPDKQRQILKAMQSAGQKWLTDEEFNKQFETGIKIAGDAAKKELPLQFWLFGIPYNLQATPGRQVYGIAQACLGIWIIRMLGSKSKK